MEGVILSTWDHIMGPQIEKLWLVDENSNNKCFEVPMKDLRVFNVSKLIINTESFNSSIMETYAAMCGQLLLGEVDSCRAVWEWPSRVYVSENKILLAIMFHLNFWRSPSSNKNLKDVCLCFGALFKYFKYNSVLHSYLSIDHQLRKVVTAFINSKFSVASCLKNVIALVEDVTELMTAVNNLYLNNMIDFLQPFRIFSSCFVLSSNFSCCIESHMQTSGNTVVIGDSNILINEVIYLLLKFSCPMKPSSSFKKSYSTKSTIKGITIPFSNKDLDNSSKFLLNRKNKELGPLTIIDLNMKKVWQSNFKINIKTGKREDTLHIVNETGYLVPEFISDVLFIEENEGDYRKHVEEFKLGLVSKSCALIKSIDHSRISGKFLSKKELMIMFSIQNLVDLEILLGYAENIKPGIRSIVT